MSDLLAIFAFILPAILFVAVYVACKVTGAPALLVLAATALGFAWCLSWER